MGGIMRPISVPNFVNSNIEYVEFWMMDPYADGKLRIIQNFYYI
jgi:cell surface protein SprA